MAKKIENSDKKLSPENKKSEDAIQIQLGQDLVPMYNGPATDQFSRICTAANPPVINAITKTATIEEGLLTVFIEGYGSLKGIRTSTLKLLDVCTLFFTRQNQYKTEPNIENLTVRIPLSTYMEICGVKDSKPSRDKMRIRIKQDLDTLMNTKLKWSEPDKKSKDHLCMNICYKAGIMSCYIIFSFSPDLARYLCNAYVMQYPPALLKVDERNPNVYSLGRKLMLHWGMKRNQTRKTSNIISVKSLLKACPTIPSYDIVMQKEGQVKQRIIRPLELALNSLTNIKWEYVYAKDKPVPEDVTKKMDYSVFENLYVQFDVIDDLDRVGSAEIVSEDNMLSDTSSNT